MTSVTRFGRLAYTSSDSVPGAAPGWGVKESEGGLDARETAELVARMPQLVAWDREVPPTAGAAEKEHLPRRLAQYVIPDVGACLFHTTPAGTDDSGRPGNTYTQVVLDRSPDTLGDRFRPTDAWRSPDWAVPFSKFEVADARLGPWERPALGTLDEAEEVVGFVLDADHPMRVFALPCVLDVMVAALEGGPMAVLGVDDADEGAAWLATALHLMAPVTARHAAFSTFERAATVPGALEAGLRIVCVPRGDLASVEGPVTVIDTHAEQQSDADHTVHLLPDGTRVPVSDFSRVATAVVDDESVAVRLFSLVDERSVDLGEVDLPIDLPVAVAFLDYVRELADGGDEFAEARAAAARIVRRGRARADAPRRADRIRADDPAGSPDSWPAAAPGADPSAFADPPASRLALDPMPVAVPGSGSRVSVPGPTGALVTLSRLVPVPRWSDGSVDAATKIAVQAAWLVAVVSGAAADSYTFAEIPADVLHIPEGDPSMVLTVARRSLPAEALTAAAFLVAGTLGRACPVPAALEVLGQFSVGGLPVLATYGRQLPPGLNRGEVAAAARRLLAEAGEPGDAVPVLDDCLDQWLSSGGAPPRGVAARNAAPHNAAARSAAPPGAPRRSVAPRGAAPPDSPLYLPPTSVPRPGGHS